MDESVVSSASWMTESLRKIASCADILEVVVSTNGSVLNLFVQLSFNSLKYLLSSASSEPIGEVDFS